MVVVGEEEVVVSALGGLAGAPSAVLSVPAASLLSKWLALNSSCFRSCLWLGSRAGIFRRPKLDFQQGGHFPIHSSECQAGISARSPYSVESGI